MTPQDKSKTRKEGDATCGANRPLKDSEDEKESASDPAPVVQSDSAAGGIVATATGPDWIRKVAVKIKERFEPDSTRFMSIREIEAIIRSGEKGASTASDASIPERGLPCDKHGTFPKPDEPCWQCVVECIPAPFNDDMIRRIGLPRDVMGLIHDLCYHHEGRDVDGYVKRAQRILSVNGCVSPAPGVSSPKSESGDG
jgi:hypothetical protein